MKRLIFFCISTVTILCILSSQPTLLGIGKLNTQTKKTLNQLGNRTIPGPLPPNILGSVPELEITRGVVFGKNGGIPLQLDILKPKALKGQKAPICVYFHGGGWREGNRYGIYNSIKIERVLLFQLGFAVASVDYRLTQQAKHPAQINDCKLAIRFLRKNADKYGIDPNRIGVWGHSAGGHLVALLGSANDKDGLEGPGLEGVSSAVQAVVELYGPTDLLLPVGEVGWSGITEQLLGCKPKNCPDRAKNASPVTYADKKDPPTIIIHGDRDSAILYIQGEAYAKKLKQASADVALIKVKNAEHQFTPYPFGSKINPNLAYIRWLIAAHFARHLEPGYFGDLNLDGKVNFTDWVLMMGQMGKTGAGMDGSPGPDDWNPLADLVPDGKIGMSDLLALLRVWITPKKK